MFQQKRSTSTSIRNTQVFFSFLIYFFFFFWWFFLAVKNSIDGSATATGIQCPSKCATVHLRGSLYCTSSSSSSLNKNFFYFICCIASIFAPVFLPLLLAIILLVPESVFHFFNARVKSRRKKKYRKNLFTSIEKIFNSMIACRPTWWIVIFNASQWQEGNCQLHGRDKKF